MLKIGHRGACGYQPENTMLSFTTAVACGADAIELDVRRTKDGHVVVIHDESVDRTTNGRGLVRNFTLRELQRLDAAKEEKIPTLEKVFETFGNRITYNIEIKEGRLRKRLQGVIKKYGVGGSVIISSFPEHWVDVLCLSTNFRAGLLVRNSLSDADIAVILAARRTSLYSIYSIHVPKKIFDWNGNFLRMVRERTKAKVFVWTCNEISEIEKFKKMGVDGIFSDYPDRL